MSDETSVRVGDTVRERVDAIGWKLSGTVIYVHPMRRFYTVRFKTRYGSFCECFTGHKYIN